MRRGRGFTLIEGLVAAFIMAVAITAMFGAWSTCFHTTKLISETTSAAEVAQSQLEIAKVFGAANMPLGTYNSGTTNATWTGAYIPSSGWTSGGLAYYDQSGNQLASSSSTGVFFSASVAMTDSNVLAGTGTSYTLQANTIRALIVTVRNVATGAVDYTMATYLVQGGL
jgi:type II secretory pathway pseudopilin PulG